MPGALAGIAIPAGGVRHHVAVTEEHPAFTDTPMVFDVPSGLYWRPEEGGLLFGMSDPDEPPGENRLIDFDYLALMRSKLAALVPPTGSLGIRRAWAATIDFTPPTTCRSSARHPATTRCSSRRPAAPS